MPIALLVPALIEALPGLIGDAIALAALLEGSGAAVRAATADGTGVVPLETVRALGLSERQEEGANG